MCVCEIVCEIVYVCVIMCIYIYIYYELLFIIQQPGRIWRQLWNIKVLSDKFNRGKCLYLSIMWSNKVTIKSVRYL